MPIFEAVIVAAAASLSSDGGRSSFVEANSGLVKDRIGTVFSKDQYCAVPDRPQPKEIPEVQERRAIAEAQNKMLDAVLKPMEVHYEAAGFKIKLQPSKDWVLVIVSNEPKKGDAFWNAVKGTIDANKYLVAEEPNRFFYLVPKQELRTEHELRAVTDRGGLPFLSSSYTQNANLEVPFGSIWVEALPGKSAIDALHEFARRNKLECVERGKRFELRMTSVSRMATVFDVANELNTMSKVVRWSEPRIISGLQKK